jgi:hypothetical protein
MTLVKSLHNTFIKNKRTWTVIKDQFPDLAHRWYSCLCLIYSPVFDVSSCNASVDFQGYPQTTCRGSTPTVTTEPESWPFPPAKTPPEEASNNSRMRAQATAIITITTTETASPIQAQIENKNLSLVRRNLRHCTITTTSTHLRQDLPSAVEVTKPVLRIHDILVRIRIRGAGYSFSAYYFLKVHLHHFKDKKSKRSRKIVTKQ